MKGWKTVKFVTKLKKNKVNINFFKVKYHSVTMFLVTFCEVTGLKAWHYIHEKKGFDSKIQKIQKISIFLSPFDLGFFEIMRYLNLGLFKVGG